MFNIKKYSILSQEVVTLPTNEKIFAYRIQANRDLPAHNITAGTLGGYVTHKNILSHKGDAWIGGDAIVANHGFGRSHVAGNSIVKDAAYVSNSSILDNTTVSGVAKIYESVTTGDVIIDDRTIINDSYLNSYEDPSAVILISGDAILWHSRLYGSVSICDNARITKMHLDASLGGRIHILDKANVSDKTITPDRIFKTHNASDLIEVSGKAIVSNTQIQGYSIITDNAVVESAKLIGRTEIRDNSKVNAYAELGGKCKLTGSTTISREFRGSNIVLHDSIAQTTRHIEKKKPKPAWLNYDSSNPPVETPAVEKAVDFRHELKVIADIEADYAKYTNDIINLIRYPAMADASIPETRDLIRSLRNARREAEGNDKDRAVKAVTELENAFIIAENRAQTLAASYLQEKSRNSLNKAEQLLKIAIDEAASDNERSLGFKAGIKALEGVIPVSADAIEAFKTKNGLLQLEA